MRKRCIRNLDGTIPFVMHEPFGRKSFTLVELLIVIAIIGILCTMLIPSLQKAKKTARSALCMSVIKQVGHGFSAYANDYNNWGVASYNLGANPWPRIMGSIKSDNPYGLGYIQWDYIGKTGMMICPDRTKPRESMAYVDYGVPYTLGQEGVADSKARRVSSDQTLMKVDSVRTPSCLGWAGDSNDSGSYGVWVLRHNKMVNVLFVDLHAEHVLKLPPKTYYESGRYEGEWAVGYSANSSKYPFSGDSP